jgi:hypothetical protein
MKNWFIDITVGKISLSIGDNWVSGSPSEDIDEVKHEIFAVMNHVYGFIGEGPLCSQCEQPLDCPNCQGEAMVIGRSS